MRNIYIALIFIGCLSLSQAGIVEPEPYPTRPAAAACTSTDPVTGCKTCANNTDPATNGTIAFVCAEAETGYFIDATSKQADVCPRSCATCTEGTACVSLADTNGFTNFTAQSCKSGYAFDNGAADNSNFEAVCISVASDGAYTCITDFIWDSTPNPQRKCIAKTAACQTGYTLGTGATPICDKCAQNYNQLSGVSINGNNEKYQINVCVNYQAPTPRSPVQCEATGTNPTTSCLTCEAGTCTKAAAGYFLNPSNQTVACSEQCSECSAANVCTKCPSGAVNANNNCDCQTGYVPNIDQSLITNPANSFTCVSYQEGAPCQTGYAWNTASILADSTKQACINIYGSGSCFSETVAEPEFDQTCFWNAPVNPNTANQRQCVLKNQGDCQTGYSVDGTITKKITGDCVKCVEGIPTLSGVGVYGSNQYYSYPTLCQQQTQLPTRPAGEACTALGIHKTGCDKCTGNKCTVFSKGYFNSSNVPEACPLLCSECNDATTCTQCSDNSAKDATGNCVCSIGYAPSIDRDSAKTSISYACISQIKNYPCSTNYVWNTPSILLDSTNFECINKYDQTASCYVDSTPKTTLIQTGFWNAPINPNTQQDRSCVLTGSGDCQVDYSVDGNITTKISGDCFKCANGIPSLSGVGIYGSNQYYPFTTLCQEVTQFDERPVGVACTAADAPTTGCEKCTGGKCTEFSEGYFNSSNVPAACPLQCSECNDVTACTKCPENSEKDANNNCICKNGYAPSIDRASATISNSYACISQIDNTLCSDNYVWNTPSILADSSNFECINIYDQKATCYVDSTPKTTLIQTGYWNAPINPATASQRSCVLTGQGSCLTNYATANNISANISSSCTLCAAGINPTNGIGQDAKNQYYNYTLCMVQEVTQLRAKAVQCNGTDTSTNGCDVCSKTKGLCTAPKPGYFINTTNPNPQPSRLRNLAQVLEEGEGYAYACNSQCATCVNGSACETCQPGYLLSTDKKNCLCQGENIIPSISEDQALLPTSSFVCINKFTSTCTSNYTWNSQVPLTNLQEYKCINLYDNQCYLQTAGGSGTNQTNYWDSAPNPNRKCVLATNGQCASSYAQVEGGSSKSDNLTQNCNFCASGLVMSNDALNKTCGAPSNSSLLSLSFILFSLILALII